MTDPSSWPPPTGGARHEPPRQPHPGPWAPPHAEAPTGAGQAHQPQPQPQSSGPWAPPQGGAWHEQPRPAGGLMLHTRFSWLAFALYFCSPKVSIDGSEPITCRWGDNPLPGLAPGRHHVRVWFRYMLYGTCGQAEAVVDVPQHGMRLDYKAPTWFVFNKGTFENLDPGAAAVGGPPAAARAAQVPAAGQPSGAWHPDPTGRAELRYWDGQAWTGHVARGGRQAWDPI